MLIDAIHTVHAGNAVLAPQDLGALLEGRFRARTGAARLRGAHRQGTGDPPGRDPRSEQRRDPQQVFADESTVKTRVGGILRKLDLRDRVQIVVFAHEHGLAA
ncbi:hypothetical protein [Streptacidiphilus sp. EB103A]|uniref:hypothetical protein n=1 Tax=Streptacidiphilus sp. EB103A TaxID=3156275 RepID=UPI00351644CE